MKDLETLVKLGTGWARYGLDVAATSVDYASGLLRDVSKQLRETGRAIDAPTAPIEPGAPAESEPQTPPQ